MFKKEQEQEVEKEGYGEKHTYIHTDTHHRHMVEVFTVDRWNGWIGQQCRHCLDHGVGFSMDKKFNSDYVIG